MKGHNAHNCVRVDKSAFRDYDIDFLNDDSLREWIFPPLEIKIIPIEE